LRGDSSACWYGGSGGVGASCLDLSFGYHYGPRVNGGCRAGGRVEAVKS
jgi:hypothetical protein